MNEPAAFAQPTLHHAARHRPPQPRRTRRRPSRSPQPLRDADGARQPRRPPRAPTRKSAPSSSPAPAGLASNATPPRGRATTKARGPASASPSRCCSTSASPALASPGQTSAASRARPMANSSRAGRRWRPSCPSSVPTPSPARPIRNRGPTANPTSASCAASSNCATNSCPTSTLPLWQMAERGWPMVRPLWWHNPADDRPYRLRRRLPLRRRAPRRPHRRTRRHISRRHPPARYVVQLLDQRTVHPRHPHTLSTPSPRWKPSRSSSAPGASSRWASSAPASNSASRNSCAWASIRWPKRAKPPANSTRTMVHPSTTARAAAASTASRCVRPTRISRVTWTREGDYEPPYEHIELTLNGLTRAPHAVTADGESYAVVATDPVRRTAVLGVPPFETLEVTL